MLTPQQLHDRLAQQFDLVCFHDLATTSSSHGAAFRLFRDLHKSVYKDRERLVFYSSSKPPQILLDHVQRAAATVDISNWFIIICGPHDITASLHQSNTKHGYDDVQINWYQVELQDTLPLSSDQIYPIENLCYKPFHELLVGPDGKVKPCCKFTDSVGDLRQSSYQEIMQDSALKNLRDQFRQGRRPDGCRICWQKEDQGLSSLRQHELQKNRLRGDADYIDDTLIRTVHFVPTNICNFTCRICNWTLSSKIASEEIRFAKNDADTQQIISWSNQMKQYDFSWHTDNLNDILPDIDSLHLLGGEPLLIKDLNLWLEYLISKNLHTKIRMEINTNGSVWRQDIIDNLKRFKSVEVLLSIDDIGPRFELQRGGTWEEVDKNLKHWVDCISANFTVKASITINIQNIMYLDQLCDYCDKLGIDKVWCYLENPDYLCIDRLTRKARNMIVERYHDHKEPELRSIASSLAKQDDDPDPTAFLEYTAKLDRQRKENFANDHADIYHAMLPND